MIHKIFKKFMILSLLALLIPVFLIPTNSKNNDIVFFNNLTPSGSDVYGEDFTTTVFKHGATTASGWGYGAITNTRNYSTTLLDLESTANPIIDIDVQGRYAYAAVYDTIAGIDSIVAFNINDPTNIINTGGDSNWFYTMAVEADGEYLYAGQVHPALSYSIVVHDILIPGNPNSVNGHGNLDGFTTDIEKDGHLIYFTNYNATSGYSLKILYAEDPLNLGLITCDWASSKALGLAVQGTNVYVAAGDEGFYVLNTTNKYYPIEMDHLPLPGNATDVIIDGNVAYIAAGPAGLFTIDVSDPTNIKIIGSHEIPGNAKDLVKQGNTLFVASGNGGVQVFDVADPNNPTFVTTILIPYAYCVDLYGGILVIGAENGLYTFQICAGNGVTNIEDHVFENIFDSLEAWDVRVQGDIAIVAGGPDGLYTLDIQDPNNPILLDQSIIGINPFYRKLDVRGNFAYIADYGTAFRVYDISDPTNIFETDSRSLIYCTDVAISGDMAYLADGPAGVYIYNISNPYYIPLPFSSFDIFTNLTAIDVQGNQLFVVENILGAPNAASFFIYDISDIDNEVLFGFNIVNAQFYDVYVDGNVAYTSDTDWMLPYNITNLINPVWTTYTLSDSLGTWGFGPYCLSADNIDGVSLSDCTNMYAADPRISIYPNATAATQITTNGDYTYIANRSSLIILRHYESAADTYVNGPAFAQSLEVDSMAFGEIKSATLTPVDFVPPGTQIDYFMSADGGAHWEAVIPGVEYDFVYTGDDLRWKVEFLGSSYRSAHVYHIEITYEFNEAPTQPAITDLGDKTTGIFKVDWTDSTDDVAVDHYVLQMSDSLSFISIQNEWTTTKSNKLVMLGKGTFYFRVQAVDDEGYPSPWSLVKQVETKLSTMVIGIIAGGGLIVIILAIVIPLVLIRRKKKIPTR